MEKSWFSEFKVPQKNEPERIHLLPPCAVRFCSVHKHFRLVDKLHHHHKRSEMFHNRRLATPAHTTPFPWQTNCTIINQRNSDFVFFIFSPQEWSHNSVHPMNYPLWQLKASHEINRNRRKNRINELQPTSLEMSLPFHPSSLLSNLLINGIKRSLVGFLIVRGISK